MKNQEQFEIRLAKHKDELSELYRQLYHDAHMFDQLLEGLRAYAAVRDQSLKQRDAEREADADWFRGSDLLGMMMYIDNFGGNLQGVKAHLPYLKACSVNCLHLMPFLASPKGRSDGGYAVSDFRSVEPRLGKMEELAALAATCHESGMNICMDFVMNHTSEDHAWAKQARAGIEDYRDFYFFYDNDEIPKKYEETVPQVFPTTAPGNFTWLEDCGQYVMTTFYPYQWDLNYKNPRVFNEMMFNFLYLANQGVDILRIDAVPYIWKELGTTSRNLPEVHTIVRMMRIIGEIVCPGVLLLGEVVMAPEKVAPYFGTTDRPECHMLYNVTTMATIWHSVATGDIRLLKKGLDTIYALPKNYLFLNYLRCHDDLGWGLDYPELLHYGMDEVPHKKFLNDYFTGKYTGSVSRGELYNDDPVTMDARLCGTTASLCGLECALETQDETQMEAAIQLDLMLHAFMMTQSGIPMLYSGDEVGHLNDYTYKEDPDKVEDSRYLHRGVFDWKQAEAIYIEGTPQQRIFSGLKKLEEIRKSVSVFKAGVPVYTYEVYNEHIIGIVREDDETSMLGFFNFSEAPEMAWLQEEGVFENMLTGASCYLEPMMLQGHEFLWVMQKKDR